MIVAREVSPDAGIRSVSALGRVDYQDAFTIDVPDPGIRSAEAWMREILEGAPVGTRVRLLTGWTAIGLRVGLPGSGGTVLGWQIRAADADCVLLGADSRIGMPGELLLRRQETGLLFSTRVRQDNFIARRLWSSIEATHVQTVRHLLEFASRRAAG